METTSRPAMEASETLASYFKRLDAWKDQGDWVPASNKTETPFVTRSGTRLLYCYQPRSGKHAYLHCDSDLILTYEESQAHLGMS